MAKKPKPSAQDRRWFTGSALIVAGALIFSVAVGLIVLPITQAPGAGIDAWTAICRAIGLAPGTPAQPQPTFDATAAPVSQVEWTPRTLRILASADTRPGAALAADVCSACHGEEGLSITDEFPRLAGQSPAAIYKQLSDYKSGARVHPQMSEIVKTLTNEQLAEVAAYFGASPARVALGRADVLAEGEMADIILRGDPARRLPPCESCHARGSGGPPEAPVIAGQNAGYIERQLLAFKHGERRNDVYRRMRDIAARLSDEEIAGVSRTYQGTY